MDIYILQIDTATEVCSLSLSLDGQVVDQIDATEPNLHASKLTVFIDELLQRNNTSYKDLAAIAVSKGPGSYTGLRIGVSSAKGLCYALDIPLIAVNTLESMFRGYTKLPKGVCDLYVPMLDARRMEVYMMIFDKQGQVLATTEAVIIDKETFYKYSEKQICLFGSGADKLADLLADKSNIKIDSTYVHSSAHLAISAFEKFENKEFEDLIYFEPYYLKEFIATSPKAVKL
ncbi:MAG: tRNA (adenosine(37)-N6)-threonylcarbamoyltransferase complex dimerization subunit type 1 TsaB [Sphingobacterium composti]